jgi:hypothetical protein
MSLSSKYSSTHSNPHYEKALPPRPLKVANAELETSMSKGALVLENAQLRGEVARLTIEVEILHTQLVQSEDINEKSDEIWDRSGIAIAKIRRLARIVATDHEEGDCKLDEMKKERKREWDEYKRLKHSSGIRVDELMEGIKERIDSRASELVDVGIRVNMDHMM